MHKLKIYTQINHYRSLFDQGQNASFSLDSKLSFPHPPWTSISIWQGFRQLYRDMFHYLFKHCIAQQAAVWSAPIPPLSRNCSPVLDIKQQPSHCLSKPTNHKKKNLHSYGLTTPPKFQPEKKKPFFFGTEHGFTYSNNHAGEENIKK